MTEKQTYEIDMTVDVQKVYLRETEDGTWLWAVGDPDYLDDCEEPAKSAQDALDFAKSEIADNFGRPYVQAAWGAELPPDVER